jgi:flagellar motility protein MotE (MotC chaperone)
MNFERIKIIPLLVFVAMLAFTVRFAEVVHGFATLPGAALAAAVEEAVPPKQADLKSAEDAAKEEAKPVEATPASAPEDKAAEKPADDKSAEGEAKPEIEPVEWHDAEDSDTEFSNVRTELYDNLGKRREELDKREADLVTREALLRAAEQEIDRKYSELSQLRGEIEKLLQKQSDEEQARIVSLVKIYEGMKPADAARIFDTLDIDILLSVMSRMSERKLSPIMAVMNPERAKTMTIMLAEQKQLPQLPAN